MNCEYWKFPNRFYCNSQITDQVWWFPIEGEIIACYLCFLSSFIDIRNCRGFNNFNWKINRFCYRLFEEHGELLTLFEKFKSLKSKEDQATSLELAEHATTVMTTLDEGIKGLDDLDTFFEYLHQVGASHRRIPGFKAEYFWVSALFLFCKTIVNSKLKSKTGAVTKGEFY